jgi:hypothetical protein
MDSTHESLANPRSLSDDDGDPAKEEPLPVRLEEELCPKGSVPLHRLCDRCRRMFDTLADEYARFVQAKSAEEREFEDWDVESCTLADLVEDQESCHFCAIVFSNLRYCCDLVPSYSVAFRLREVGIHHLGMTLGVEVREKDYYLTRIHIYIKPFTRESYALISKWLH